MTVVNNESTHVSLIKELAARRHKLLATSQVSIAKTHSREIGWLQWPWHDQCLFPLMGVGEAREIHIFNNTSKAKIVGNGCVHTSFHESHIPFSVLHRYFTGFL